MYERIFVNTDLNKINDVEAVQKLMESFQAIKNEIAKVIIGQEYIV